MPQTGEVCNAPGTYESDCEHEVRIKRTVGQPFPECGACGGPVDWIALPISQQTPTVHGASCPVRYEGPTVRPVDPRSGR